jgi:hypothetical protein
VISGRLLLLLAVVVGRMAAVTPSLLPTVEPIGHIYDVVVGRRKQTKKKKKKVGF